MDRQKILLAGITKDQLGLEIGPYHSPLVPKSAGYNSIVLDVFDQKELRARAKAANIADEFVDRIEGVDLLGSVTGLGDMINRDGLEGQLDYIISSHNFEHIPDPIRFLQACVVGLRPGGRLIMAIPDRRYCFDHFRPHSITADFVAAYFEKRNRPAPHQIFTHSSLHSVLYADGVQHLGFSKNDDPSHITPLETLSEAYQEWLDINEHDDGSYHDAHCWAFTPSSFELILEDLWFLGLTRMRVQELHTPHNLEFYAKLSVGAPPANSDRGLFYARRTELLRSINRDFSVNSMNASYAPFGLAASQEAGTASEMKAWEVAAEMRRRVAAIENSTSWRMTAPLRRIARRLRRAASQMTFS